MFNVESLIKVLNLSKSCPEYPSFGTPVITDTYYYTLQCSDNLTIRLIRLRLSGKSIKDISGILSCSQSSLKKSLVEFKALFISNLTKVRDGDFDLSKYDNVEEIFLEDLNFFTDFNYFDKDDFIGEVSTKKGVLPPSLVVGNFGYRIIADVLLHLQEPEPFCNKNLFKSHSRFVLYNKVSDTYFNDGLSEWVDNINLATEIDNMYDLRRCWYDAKNLSGLVCILKVTKKIVEEYRI